MNLKTIAALVLALAGSIGAAPAPYPITINSRAPSAPPVMVFAANEATFRASFVDGGTASDLTGGAPFMAWYTNTAASSVSTANVSVVGLSTGLVDFVFTPAKLNHAAGRYGYEIGVKAGSTVRVYRQGVFTINASPSGGGAAAVDWLTPIDWSTVDWSNLPAFASQSDIGATSDLDRAYTDAALLDYPLTSALGGIIATSPVNRAGYATSSGFATNADHSATSTFATNAQTAAHAQTATALTTADGTWWTSGGTNYVVTPDTNRVYIASASTNYNGPAVGTVLTWNGVEYQYGAIFFSSLSTIWSLEDSSAVDAVWITTRIVLPAEAYEAREGATGICVIDYVPVTNITVDVSAATFIILAARVGTNETDIAALEAGQAQRPTFAATTNIVTALAGSGTTIYTPVYAATTTVSVNATQAVYKATFGAAGAVTQSIAGLTVNAGQEARWELWLNCTNPAALAPTWQSNLDWQNGTPELTVTGLYKFAMSTTGTRITGRQTYPTVNCWSAMQLAATGASGYDGPWDGNYVAASNALAFYRGHRYQDYVMVEIGILAGGDGNVQAKSVFASGSDGCTTDTSMTATKSFSAGLLMVRLAFAPRASIVSTPQVILRVRVNTLSTATRACVAYCRIMNELEVKAYNAGWRP